MKLDVMKICVLLALAATAHAETDDLLNLDFARKPFVLEKDAQSNVTAAAELLVAEYPSSTTLTRITDLTSTLDIQSRMQCPEFLIQKEFEFLRDADLDSILQLYDDPLSRDYVRNIRYGRLEYSADFYRDMVEDIIFMTKCRYGNYMLIQYRRTFRDGRRPMTETAVCIDSGGECRLTYALRGDLVLTLNAAFPYWDRSLILNAFNPEEYCVINITAAHSEDFDSRASIYINLMEYPENTKLSDEFGPVKNELVLLSGKIKGYLESARLGEDLQEFWSPMSDEDLAKILDSKDSDLGRIKASSVEDLLLLSCYAMDDRRVVFAKTATTPVRILRFNFIKESGSYLLEDKYDGRFLERIFSSEVFRHVLSMTGIAGEECATCPD